MLLNLLSYDGAVPELAGLPRAAHAGHALIGRATIGREAWFGAGSVIRADAHYVRAGDDLRLGRGATVHIAHARWPSVMGQRVSVGANAVVHACTLGDDVIVEEDAVVLDGAEVGAGAVLEAGCVVFPRTVLPGGHLYAGKPAKAVRELTPEEHRTRAAALAARIEAADAAWPCAPRAAAAAPDAFVAGTAWLAGDVRLAAASSVWFGCRLDARAGAISVGRQCNVQDNSVLVAGPGGLAIGDGSTIGHNVELVDCTVGAHCLVGIGSRIAAGTVIADDTFVAGGAVTTPAQVLEGGWLWGGVPARKLTPLDDAKRRIVQGTATVYVEYARVLMEGIAAAG